MPTRHGILGVIAPLTMPSAAHLTIRMSIQSFDLPARISAARTLCMALDGLYSRFIGLLLGKIQEYCLGVKG